MEIRIKPYEDLTLTDDFVFCKVMQNEDVCKETIETLLHIKIKRLVYIEPQKTIDIAYNSKGVRLDVYVEDGDRVFDVEMQTTVKKNLGKRIRYYQSLIDIDTLKKGSDYLSLKESYIIFICTGDPLNLGFPCYTFKNTCQEDKDTLLDDKSTKVFYNINAYKEAGDKRTSALLEYLQNGKSSNMLTEKLNRLVYEAKNNQKWRLDYMTLEMIKTQERNEGIEKGIEKGIAIGEARGTHGKAVEAARNALLLGLSIEQIKSITGLSEEEIQNISNK